MPNTRKGMASGLCSFVCMILLLIAYLLAFLFGFEVSMHWMVTGILGAEGLATVMFFKWAELAKKLEME